MKTWLDIEDRFRALTEPLRFMRLDIQWGGSTGESWSIAGVGQSHEVVQFQALSAIAGDALIAAFKDISGKPDWLKDPQPNRRWFRALKDWGGAFRYRTYFHELDDAGNITNTAHLGGIENICEVSANVCLFLHSAVPIPSENQLEPQSVTSIHFSDSQVGLVNTGELRDVQSVNVEVNQTIQSAVNPLAAGIDEVIGCVDSAEGLKEKVTVIQQLQELRTQITLDDKERVNSGALTAIVTAVDSSLGAAHDCAQVWRRWRPLLMHELSIDSG
ncbi:MAG: hypothetical protein ACXWID_13760 [Pyrinomonadaceae bacterium]